MSSPSPHRARRRHRRRGFTMIEIMVAVGIILLLISIATLSFKYLDPSGDSTKIALGNAQSMLAELEAAGGVRGMPLGATDATLPNGTPLEVNPGSDHDADGIGNRHDLDIPTIARTNQAMARLMAVPSNRTAYANMATKMLLAPHSPPTPTPTLTNALADAWRNPIIYVPGPNTTLPVGHADRYGLRGVRLSGTPPAGTPPPIVAPGERPFFASAGPDGIFQTGDDNVYSFQN